MKKLLSFVVMIFIYGLTFGQSIDYFMLTWNIVLTDGTNMSSVIIPAFHSNKTTPFIGSNRDFDWDYNGIIAESVQLDYAPLGVYTIEVKRNYKYNLKNQVITPKKKGGYTQKTL